MGLFDYVRVDVPLPDGKPSKHFQTKDFDDPYLEQYVITSDGRLIHDRGERLIDCAFHGYLNFYDYSDAGEWREFNAKFTDGRLIDIVEVKAPTIETRSAEPFGLRTKYESVTGKARGARN